MEPSPEIWVHGLLPLPGARITETSLVGLLSLPRVASTDLAVGLDQWAVLASEGLGMTRMQAAACLRFAYLLTQPSMGEFDMPSDEALRVPLGSLLLVLWVQWAQHELGEGGATNQARAEAATGEVWPSLLMTPVVSSTAGGAGGGGAHPTARTLAVQARLQAAQLARRRRRLLQGSLPTLLQLVAAGAERMYADEFDRLGLLLRPDPASARRQLARGQRPDSVAAAVGAWASHPKAALPVASLLSALRAALVEVVPMLPTPAPAHAAPAAGAAHSPLAAAPPATPREAPAQPPTPSTGSGTPCPVILTPEDEREASSTAGFASTTEGAGVPGKGVLRLQAAKRRTLVLRSEQLQGGALQLIDCHGCYVYALAPVRTAELLGCTGCTVVLGAVARVASVSHCSSLKLLATAKALRLCNCHDCTLQLCVNTPPLVWGENHRVQLAPFGTVYEGLAAHMDTARVSRDLSANHWSRPISPNGPMDLPQGLQLPRPFGDVVSMVAKGAAAAAADAEAPCALLPPTRFVPFHVPFDIPPAAQRGEGVPPVCELPAEYANGLLSHVQRLARFHDEIDALRCPDQVRQEVKATLHAGFTDWLQRTGNIRQINDLLATPP